MSHIHIHIHDVRRRDATSFPKEEIKAALRSNDPAKVKKFINLTGTTPEEKSLIDQCIELWQER